MSRGSPDEHQRRMSCLDLSLRLITADLDPKGPNLFIPSNSPVCDRPICPPLRLVLNSRTVARSLKRPPRTSVGPRTALAYEPSRARYGGSHWTPEGTHSKTLFLTVCLSSSTNSAWVPVLILGA